MIITQELEERHKELKDMTAPWFARVREHTDRPEVMGALQTMITTADKFLTQVWISSSIQFGCYDTVFNYHESDGHAVQYALYRETHQIC